jgi:hypothetical protein
MMNFPIRPAVIQNMINCAKDIKAKLSPEAYAAYDAVVKAMQVPDSLIKITFTSVEQLSSTLWSLLHLIREMGVLDNEKTLPEPALGQWPILELVNGSGIQLVIERAS